MSQLPPAIDYRSPERSSEIRKIFLFYFVLNLIFACFPVGFLLYVIPHFQEIFKDFRTTLPALTEWTIYASDRVIYGYGWIPLIPMMAGWCMFLAWWYVKVEKNPWHRRFLSAGILLFYLTVLAVLLTAIIAPFVKLIQSVSGGST